MCAERLQPSDLEDRLQAWIRAGVLTGAQAEAIREFELGDRPAGGDARRVSVAVEAVGYLGGALVLIAVGLFFAELWEQLETWARLSLVGVVTVVLWAAGAVTSSRGEPAVRRLSSFLWFLSTAGAAFFAGLVLDDPIRAGESSVTLGVGVVTTAWSGVLWTLRRTALQQIAVFGGLVVTCVGLLMVLEVRPPELAGLGVWALGIAWAVLAWGRIAEPTMTGYALGCVAILAGAQVASFGDFRGWAIALGVASAASLMASGALVRRTLLLGFGVAGVFVFVPQAVFEWFGDTLGAPVALFVAGVVLLSTAVGAVVLRRRVVEDRP